MGSRRRSRPAAAARLAADQAPSVAVASGGSRPTAAVGPPGTAGGRKVYAANLPFTVSKWRVWSLFEQFGKVTNVHLVRNRADGQFRGFGFVTFKDQAGTQNALAAVGSRSLHLQERQIRVSPAQPRRSRSPVPSSTCSRAGRRPFVPTGPCHVDRLPAELLQLVVSFLSLREQVATAQWVSHRWQAAVRDLLHHRREVDLRDYLVPRDHGRLHADAVEGLLRLTPRLRTLRTGGVAHGCSGDTVDALASHCSRLVSIDLASASFSLDEKKLEKLVTHCPRLEEIKLPTVYLYNEVSLRVLLLHLPRLRSLELSAVGRTTGSCFSLLPVTLRRLYMGSCHGLRSRSVRHVARCTDLRELDISCMPGLLAEDLAAALAGCPRLERLMAAGMLAPPERYLPPAGAAALTHLDVESAAGVTDATLRRLPELAPALRLLNMQDCASVSEAGLCHLGRCVQLRTLDLSYLRGTSDSALDQLHGRTLSELRLAQGSDGPAAFTTQGVIRLVLGCPSLKLLDLSCVEQLTVDLIDQLVLQLPPARNVTIYVGETPLERRPPPPSGPLHIRDFLTVPPCRRVMTIDMLWNENDDAEEVFFIRDWRNPPRQ